MRASIAALAVTSLMAALPAQAQAPKQWDVWVDRQHCADTRAGWLAVADQHPGYGWDKMPGAPTSQLFMEAIANMDAMRVAGPFRDFCCKFVVWREQSTSALALVRDGDVATAGWLPESAPMCAETAILEAGMDDVLGALTLPLGSVPGATVTITANGPVTSSATPVSIPTNPPMVVSPSPSVDTVGDITGETGGPPGPPADLPDGVVARVEASFSLSCERVDMAASTYAGTMMLDFAADGVIGAGTATLSGAELGRLDFVMQTQLVGDDLGAIGNVQEPGQGVGRVEITVIGKRSGAGSASGEVKVGISMKARFANGRTPGDGSCTGKFAT